MLSKCSLSALWVLNCSLIALLPRKMKIDCSRQTCPWQTDRWTLAFLELLSEPKMYIIERYFMIPMWVTPFLLLNSWHWYNYAYTAGLVILNVSSFHFNILSNVLCCAALWLWAVRRVHFHIQFWAFITRWSLLIINWGMKDLRNGGLEEPRFWTII